MGLDVGDEVDGREEGPFVPGTDTSFPPGNFLRVGAERGIRH